MSAKPAKEVDEVTKKKNPKLYARLTKQLAKDAVVKSIILLKNHYRVEFTDQRLGACVTNLKRYSYK